MIFSLGNFTFLTLARTDNTAGPPDFPRERLEVVERPGINGTGLILLGVKGRPFSVRGVVPVTSRPVGLDLVAAYHASITGDILTLIWADENITVEYGIGFQIVDVLEANVQGLAASSNGAGALVTVTLSLLPVVI